MNILYLGDVMGDAGMRTVERVLPGVVRETGADAVIAQAENVTAGKGLSPKDFKRLIELGVHGCTGGNWSLHRKEIYPQLSDPAQPVVRPANYPDGTPGLGAKYVKTPGGTVLMISLQGHIVGRDADKPFGNPLHVIDAILEREQNTQKDAVVVNLHGDFSSEKVVLGYYLDGRVSLVVGDHWHVPTADAQVLPRGTAHQTDVGMCGVLHGSLGVKLSSVIPRWRDNIQTVNELENDGPLQFNALLVKVGPDGRAHSAQAVRHIVEASKHTTA